ncbi:hypothetical protein [Streptomyces populi]|nr:hypothetical protein [Streptomyces populi]
MPALTPDSIRTLPETLSDFTDSLRESPDLYGSTATSEPGCGQCP